MSLVVHKLVLSPGGATTNTQPPTHHVTLSAYTHPRSNVSDTMGRVLDGPSSGSMSTPPSSSSPYSTSSSSSSSSKHSSTYNLPFVLQDHNYGAPPPPTPPQSPPPLPSSSGSSVYHHPSQYLHQPHHQHNPQPHQSNHPHSLQQHTQQNTNNLYHSQHKQQYHNHPQQATSHVNPSPRLGIITSSGPSVSVSGLLTSHPINTMPPHRQQFMPHPKTSIFPSPHIPPPPVELHQSPPTITGPPSSTTGAETDDDSRMSDRSSSVGPSGEETETAPEGEGDEQPVDDSITRCVCDFSHDDGYMIQCDRCFVWQHVDCMEIDRDNIPDEYLCEACDLRPIDRFKARALQIRRRQEIKAHLASSFRFRLSSSDSDDNIPMSSKGRGTLGKIPERKVVKKKKVKQIKDMKNGRKGSLSLLKKSNVVTTSNNNIIPGMEDKERRMLVKRRRKSSSMSGGEGVSDDSNSGPVERLRAWVEGYEVAVTNHYSPELRARVHAARINGVSPDLRASTQGAVLGHRCKVVENPHPLFDVFDCKILVAATRLCINTAITEFQGKYLLASQWNAQQPVSGQPYLPYVLQYHMPKEGLTVCVDARTYGNDARFTRRSCTPNAEVRHVVERGSLHLYLVATRDIEEGEEVTLALETANSNLELMCCLSEEHDCQAPQPSKVEQTSPVPTTPHKKNGLILSNKKTFKKQQLQLQLRTSKRTTSTESRNSDNVITPSVNSTPVTPLKQRRASGCGKSPAKSPSASVSSSPEDSGKDSTLNTPPTAATTPEMPKCIDKQQQQKMTREERKIAAYMKAFERMEKAAQRRQEMEKKKEEDKVKDPKDKDKKRCDGEEEDWEKTSSADESVRNTPGAERSRRKGKKGRGKGSPQKRTSHRVDSTASDLTGDESSCASVGLMSPLGASIEGIALNFNSPPQGSSNAMGFRFPKTKKALMNEWLNENVDPVLPGGNITGVAELPSGVPTCYMRSPATPLRRSSVNQSVIQGTILNLEMPGGSAKKRWLRQAISEETESPQFNGLCPSPNSRPDSPTGGGDYITPLKKRRLARESMSSELSSTPPSTPVHSTSLEEDKMIEEMEAELAEEAVSKLKQEDGNYSEDPACLMIHGVNPSEFHNTKDSSAKIKEMVNEGNEELIAEEDKHFFDRNIREIDKNGLYSEFQEDMPGTKIKKAEEMLKRNAVRDCTLKTRYSVGFSVTKTLKEESEQEDNDNEGVGERNEQMGLRRGRKYQQETKRERRQHIINRERKQQVPKRERRQQCTKKGKSYQMETKCERNPQRQVKKKRGQLVVIKVREERQEIKEEAKQEKKKEFNKLEIKEEIKQKLKKATDRLETQIDIEKETVKKEVEEQELRDKIDVREIGKETEEHKVTIDKAIEVRKEKNVSKEVGEKIEEEVKLERVEMLSEKESQLEETLPENESKDIKRIDKQPEEVKIEENQEIEGKITNQGEGNVSQDKEKNKREKDKKTGKKTKVVHSVKREKDEQEELKEDAKVDVQGDTIEQLPQVSETSDQDCVKEELPAQPKLDGTQRSSPRRRRVKICPKELKQVLTEVKYTQQNLNKECGKVEKQKKGEEEQQMVKSEVEQHVVVKTEESQVQCVNQDKNEHLDTKNDEEPVTEVEESNLQTVGENAITQDIITEKYEEQESNTKNDKDLVIKIKNEEPEEEAREDEKQDNDFGELGDLRNSVKYERKVLDKDLKTNTPLSEETQPTELRCQSPLAVTTFLSLKQSNSSEIDEEMPKRHETRSPESPRPISPELRGPHTPDGPAPTTPDESEVSPQSPGSPIHCQRNPSPAQEVEAERERTLEGESLSERRSRSRTRGPCTPPSPPPSMQEENADDERQDGEASNKSSSQPTLQEEPKPAPIKRKLSILEYRKRKSVSSEGDNRGLSGPSDSSPPRSLSLTCSTVLSAPCADSSFSSNPSCSSNISTREPSISPTYFSPSKLAQTEADESSPDLALSPIQPLMITPLSIVLDSKSTKDEVKNDAESNNNNNGGGSINDNSKHGIKSSNNSVNNSCSSTTITTVATNALTTTNSIAVTNTAGTTTSTPLTTITSNATSQDVKWNAAPTLLERQRENLTARLRREFGLCISDDDEDKSGDGEDRDRNHRRHKEKNLPPPPPPPTAPPKNSIFQGREVTVQKVGCASKVGATQPSSNPTQNANCNNTSSISSGLLNIPAGNTQRLIALPGHPGSSGTNMTLPGSHQGPPPPPPMTATTCNISSSRSGPSSQSSQGSLPTAGIASSSVPVPLTPSVPPLACPVPPPIGGPVPIAMQSKLSPIPSEQSVGGTSTASHHPSSVQIGPHISPTPSTPQNPVYPVRQYSRGQYTSPAAEGVPPAISLYSSGRVAPPQPPNPVVPPQGPVGHPAPVRPQGPPAQGPPGLVSPSLGYSGGGYSGHDCSAPGSRGS
ncbi:uncharacterized protein LOC121868730 isoform X3 [Homarus americanus]|uniref:uncharacterized protein LOC121868730 isoform X3 n=1 Tax=Homarus americanus TaxID=6706 RepID=UPI001C4952F4|nr:uncharacterized protein LOC121868730 isoform X3 [Homarus americanus]